LINASKKKLFLFPPREFLYSDPPVSTLLQGKRFNPGLGGMEKVRQEYFTEATRHE
jgi:hypothetical protein